MNTDKLIFTVIAGITILITGIIVFSSLGKNKTTTLEPNLLIGENPHYKGEDPFESKLVVVEFSDFQCPFCADYALVLSMLAEKYKGEISIVYRHFPLPAHTRAIPAAKASEAAAKQNKFWEYADELFQNQANFSDENFYQYAETLSINVDQFKKDYQSEEVAIRVKRDSGYGKAINISSTPTFYVISNGKAELVQLKQINSLEEKIELLLGPGTASPDGSPLGPTPEPSDPAEPTAPETSNPPSNVVNPGSSENPDTNQAIAMPAILDLVNVKDTSIKPADVKVQSVTEVQWPDPSLGCPQPGMNYAQMITPGYKIILIAGTKTYEYHSDKNGKVVSCDSTP